MADSHMTYPSHMLRAAAALVELVFHPDERVRLHMAIVMARLLFQGTTAQFLQKKPKSLSASLPGAA